MRKVDLKCHICGNRNLTILPKLCIYCYCGVCQIAWLKKLPKVSYNQSYYQGRFSLVSLLFQPITQFFYWQRRKYVGDEKQLWIDVGAGNGEFLKTVRSKRKIGVEISKVGRKAMIRSGLETMTEQQFLQTRSLNADIISFWHVLEHMEKPWEYLRAARHNLKRDGKIVIGLPNIESWEFKFFGRDWFHLVPKYHIWHFSPRSASRMLANHGFKLRKIDYFSPEHHLTGLLQSLINSSSGTHNILHKLIKRETGFTAFNYQVIFWIIFWISVGLPFIVIFWLISSVYKKSGTFIIVASLRNNFE